MTSLVVKASYCLSHISSFKCEGKNYAIVAKGRKEFKSIIQKMYQLFGTLISSNEVGCRNKTNSPYMRLSTERGV